jgi:NADH dehydrogenase [ubiquinone] 1 alpha subcomplex assembly factor 5
MLTRDIKQIPIEPSTDGVQSYAVVADEEFVPLPPRSADVIMSSLSMHWVNDLPGTLTQIRESLKPDGVFLGAMLGGETLSELRSSFVEADIERNGGVAPRVSPFARVSDVGDLLASAGFKMATVDFDDIICRYPDMFTLLDHLSGMGEAHAAMDRPPAVSRDTFLSAASIYQDAYADEEGLLPATFQVVYMIGWAPDSSQPKPLERGTGKLGMKAAIENPDILKPPSE